MILNKPIIYDWVAISKCKEGIIEKITKEKKYCKPHICKIQDWVLSQNKKQTNMSRWTDSLIQKPGYVQTEMETYVGAWYKSAYTLDRLYPINNNNEIQMHQWHSIRVASATNIKPSME